MSDLLQAALAFHAEKLAVIAVTRDKIPCREGWTRYFEKSQSEEEVRELFSNGAYGIAMVLWPATPYAVLDFDGIHAEEAWRSTGVVLPDTARNRTRSGGKHLYFRMPQKIDFELKRKVRLVKAQCDCPKSCGVDLLIHGIAVIPPTPGYSEDPDHPLSDAVTIPDEILDLVRAQRTNESRVTGDTEGRVNDGERHATLVSLAGTMRKRGMSIEAIRAALLADNEVRFNPPVDEQEIESILKSATDWQQGGTEVITELILQDAALHGLAGDVVRTILPYTEAHPAALLIHLLCSFGNIIGHNAHWLMEHTKHYLNFFAVLVGKSSRGRKGTSRSTLDYLFKQVDESWRSHRVTSGLCSGQGLIWNVRDPITESQPIREKSKVIGYQDVIVDKGEGDKRLFVVEEEFSQALKAMPLDGNILSVVIREAWDSGDLHTLTTGRKSSPVRATDAHVSIVGHITQPELLRHLDSTEQCNGFANRFLWIAVERSKKIPNPKGTPRNLLEPLIEKIQERVTFGIKAGEITRDEEAEKLWVPLYDRLTEDVPGMVGAITSRAEAQVMRLACLYALLDLSVKIRPEHLIAALALWDYAAASAMMIFGDAMGDPVADRIAAEIKRSTEGMSETDIRDLFSRHNSKDIDRALSLLLQRGIIEDKPVPTAGRPKTIYTLRGDKSDKSDKRV